MTSTTIEEVVLNVGVLLRADGADLHLVSFDEQSSEVRVVVDLSGSECAECVIPPDLLAIVISDAINRGFGSPVSVVVDDPRVR
jgi:hypothetical protein